LLWLADKFTATEVMKYAFLPSFTLFAVATAFMYRKLERSTEDKREAGDLVRLSRGEKIVVGTALSSFTLPLLVSFVGLPPYMGLLFGLGITWSVIELAKHRTHGTNQTHMSANIEKLLQTVDIASIKYIMGILLAVGALSTLGVLLWLSQSVIGTNPSETSLVAIVMGLGFVSGIVDNASLIAIAIKTLPMNDPQLWSLAAVAAGNGGSLMVIASAAGVVAMGNFKQLTVGAYFKLATIQVLFGILASYAVWAIQYYWLFR
jgi:Na+/H+ antiporter NhaD/arsenite permease-like protein